VSGYDLIVIGAGPGGCATAITAASSGAKVLLLERGRFPRHKVCGEFVSAESLQLLERLLKTEDHKLISSAPRIARGRIFADRTEISTEIRPAAASITRFDLDAALWKSCLEHGVDARANSPVKAVEGAGPFRITTENEAVAAQSVVNATGRWSNLTAMAGHTQANGERRIGVKAHFHETSPAASVDLYFFEGGYCGVQPIGEQNGSGVVNACAMVSARCATTISDVLQLHPALKERSRHWRPLTQAVTTSPLVFHAPAPLAAGMLQVGDSATFVDPFIGDGISLALRSGVLAAECLVPFFSGNRSLPEARAEYAKYYRQRLSHVFRASSMLRGILGWPRMIRRPLLGLVQKAPSVTRRLVKMTR